MCIWKWVNKMTSVKLNSCEICHQTFDFIKNENENITQFQLPFNNYVVTVYYPHPEKDIQLKSFICISCNYILNRMNEQIEQFRQYKFE